MSPLIYSMRCAERSLGITIIPNSQEYNDSEGNKYVEGIEDKEEELEENNWFQELNEESGYPVYQWIIFIGAFLVIALILGVLCRCCTKKKRN